MPLEADVRKIFEQLFPGLMGIEIEQATPDSVLASMLVRPDLCTTGGICHGGALMALADTLGAVGTVMNLPEGARTTTIESKTNFLGAAAVNTRVKACATPVHRGRRTQVWQTSIKNEAGKLCALVTQTQLVLP
jgi:uncharacterized protein (TIGR00369 family)